MVVNKLLGNYKLHKGKYRAVRKNILRNIFLTLKALIALEFL